MHSQVIAKILIDVATRKMLAKYLRLRRQKLGITQKQAGKRADPQIDAGAISNFESTGRWNPIRKWEKAQQSIPDVYLDDWAGVLKCNPADLRAISDAPDNEVARIVILKREDSEYLDFLLELGKAPDSSRAVKESCRFLYSFLLMKALKRQSLNPHLFVK